MSSQISTAKQTIWALIFILAAVGIAALTILTKSKPEKVRPRDKAPSVEVVQVVEENRRMILKASGTVEAAVECMVPARVGSVVAAIHSQLRPGGMILAGEVLAELDSTDIKFVLKQALADLARARLELEIEEGKSETAKLEWQMQDLAAAGSPLGARARREPHLAAAKAAYISAQARVSQAELNLERCKVLAPYDLVVLEKLVDVGEVIAPSAPVARAVKAGVFWVRALLPESELHWLAWDKSHEDWGEAEMMAAESHSIMTGRILEKEAQLDSKGRLAKVLVEFKLPVRSSESLPLGSFVQLNLLGEEVPQVVALPRVAFRENGEIWLVGSGNLVRIESCQPFYSNEKEIFLRQGSLVSGDNVIVSSLSSAANGLAVFVLPSKTVDGKVGQ